MKYIYNYIHSLSICRIVGDRAVYNLYGVCNHSGTPFGGHYTALARNPYSNEWHYFNDQRLVAESRMALMLCKWHIIN